MQVEKRDTSVGTLRGVVCILVVVYHAVGSSEHSGLQVKDGEFWAVVVEFLGYFRMPLFAFIAGYIYALRPISGNTSQFLLAKARRLLLPVLTVGTIFAIVRSNVRATQGAVPDWTTLHLIPYAQYWFLEALFVLFVFTALLEWLTVLDSPLKAALTLGWACAVQLVSYRVPYLGINGATYLLPFFIVGIAIGRFKPKADTRLEEMVCLAILIYSSVYVVKELFDRVPETARVSPIGLIIGLTTCALVMRVKWNNRVLNYIGRNSYSIFLFHVFYTAGVRMGAYSIGFHELNSLVFLTSFAGVVGPIFVEKIVSQWRVTNTLLLGAKWSSGHVSDRQRRTNQSALVNERSG